MSLCFVVVEQAIGNSIKTMLPCHCLCFGYITFLLLYLFNSKRLILKCLVLDRQYFCNNLRFVEWAINTEFINHISLPYWKLVISYLHFTTGGTKMSVSLIFFTTSMLGTRCLTFWKVEQGWVKFTTPSHSVVLILCILL